jgi:membrane protein implicated in regulation of membrane protease activity
MKLGSPEGWRLVWVIVALAFVGAEMLTPAVFFFLPFGVGAAAAAVSAFAGVSVSIEWVVFLVVSAVVFAALFPLGRKLERGGSSHPVGSRRWVGREAYVLSDIPASPGGTGEVRLERERWRAETGIPGVPIPAGTTVLVSQVDGTRLVVLPLDFTTPQSLDPPPAGRNKEME